MVEDIEKDSQKHKHGFIDHSDNKHYQGGIAIIDPVFFHVYHLCRLAARGRGGYIGIEKTDKGIFQTAPEGDLLFKQAQHILDYHRFAGDKTEGTHAAKDEPQFVCTVKLTHDLGDLFIIEQYSECEIPHHGYKQHIQHIFELFVYSYHSIFLMSVSSRGEAAL
jgi:hypothetical protein